MAVPWKVVGAAVVIFSAGVISGSVATRLYQSYAKPRPIGRPEGPPPPWVGQRMDFLRHMKEALGLSPEQAERIDRLIRESQQRTRELWEPMAPKFQEEMERLKAAVDAELTAEQRAKAAELQQRRFSRPWGDRPPGRWPEGQGGPRRRGPEPDREGGPPDTPPRWKGPDRSPKPPPPDSPAAPPEAVPSPAPAGPQP